MYLYFRHAKMLNFYYLVGTLNECYGIDCAGACPKGLSTVWPKPHCRTPGFVFGVAGQVERVAGVYSDPGISALGLSAARAPKQEMKSPSSQTEGLR